MAGTGRTLARSLHRITEKCMHRGALYPPSKLRSLCTAVEESTEFELRTYWASVSASVNMAVDGVLPVGYPEKIHEAMRYSLLSAPPKMPCPLLCTAACHVIGGTRKQSLPAATAVAMLHAATLAHDELPCMDSVAPHGGHVPNYTVFGEDVAILAGDALFGLAFQHLVESKVGLVEATLRALAELARGMGSTGLVAGQHMGSVAARSGTAVDPTLLEYIHFHKAALMAEISVVVGGIVGGGSNGDVERLRGYGRSVGLMYQIVEDMLHMNGASQGPDRVTYPKVHGMERSRFIVDELNVKAKDFLSPFAHTLAAPLLSFADYAATRSY
ncbi:hypothetical protein SUGI_0550250 [Cryptomeria japonica]|uniref:geranylgeranyl pyrophosphate synthase, chloroplastic n=1 Tax=Cryptomeria japonica TaxID=3369 RepID=UPI002408EA15|nr:geranylgeranyl pyrophosphate synthase, chloroplastic [Cryptomeria japonica]GLJ28022.1 hypothetical protein SUGI_0550250 [Cryptomeria japonica]